jgi:hypothetical protein
MMSRQKEWKLLSFGIVTVCRLVTGTNGLEDAAVPTF